MLYCIEPLWNNGKQHSNKQYRNVVVFGTYNRAHLMRQSMYAYQQSLSENDAVVVLDDGSTDNTLEVCDLYAHSLDIFYFKLQDKTPGEWRDSAAFLNMGISFAIHALNAQRVIPTHPEIVPGVHTFDAINAAPEGIDFVMFRGYYLPVELQLRYEAFIDCVKDGRISGGKYNPKGRVFDWSIQTFKALCPDWYQYGDPNHDFHPNNLERDPEPFQSWIFCSATAEVWKRYGGFSESNVWGSIDLNQMARRNRGGFTIATPVEVDAWVLHQNHDDPRFNTITPRNMDLCMETCRTLDETPCQPELLNPERWKSKSTHRIEKSDLENLELDPLPIRRGCFGECACIGTCLDVVGYISRVDYEQGKPHLL